MNHEIICEDFTLTDAIKNHVESLIEVLQTHDQKPMNFHVFLSKESPALFKAGFSTRLYNKELYAHAIDADLYHAATEAKRSLRKQIIELRKKKHSHSA